MDTNPIEEVTSDADVEDRLASLFEKQEAGPEPEVQDEVKAETSEESVKDKPEAEEAEAVVEEEGEEIEIDGEKYIVPPKFKSAFMRTQDYTQKTQALAEQRRQLEEQGKFVQQTAQIQQAQFEKAVEVKLLADQVAQYEKLDWQALAQQDPAQAMSLQMQYQQLQRQLQGKAVELQTVGQQAQQLTAQQRQTMAAEGVKALKSKIPNWGAELQSSIAENTRGYGFSDAEIAEVFDPRLVEVLHDAMQWKKLQASKSSITKKVSTAKPLVKTTARSLQQGQESSKAQDLRARFRKTGRPDDVQNFLEARLLQSVKRK